MRANPRVLLVSYKYAFYLCFLKQNKNVYLIVVFEVNGCLLVVLGAIAKKKIVHINQNDEC